MPKVAPDQPRTPSPTAHEPTPEAAIRALGHDPVIHALAQRASNDAELLSAMEAVAQEKATEAQLRYLQSLVNDLTESTQQKPKKREEGDAGVTPDPIPARPVYLVR